jgi:DnaK suppressor protein
LAAWLGRNKETRVISEDLCNELHEQLLQQRQQLESEIAHLESGGIRGDTFQTDEMTDIVDQHPADAASEIFEREKNMTLVQTLQESLQTVNEALHKFDNGTYGLCEECGQPIPEKRLRALPSATHCVECQAKMEQQQR